MTKETESLPSGNNAFTVAELLAILDGVADGITVQDGTGRLLYANPAAAAVTGFETPRQMVGTPPAEIMQAFSLVDEAGNALPLSNLPGRRALQGGQAEQGLLRFRVVATGEIRWAMLKARPILASDGRVRLVINSWHDVTDHIAQQQAIEESSSQLEEITAELEATVEALQARTAEAEAAQKLAEFNAEKQRFLAEAGKLLAASLDYEETLRIVTHLAVPRIADWCTVSLIDEQGVLKQLEVAHADPEKLRFALELQKRYPANDEGSLRVIRSGESELYAEIPDALLAESAVDAEHLRILSELQLKSAMIVPLKIRNEVLGILTFIGAESGRRYGPEDLQFAESLAARSALAISNARLYAQVQQANQAKGDFLAVMSHELRTPLTAIFGYTELISTGISGPVTDTQVTQLERIRASASHLLGIIEDILSFARSEAGHDEPRNEPVQLSKVIAEAASLVHPAADKKGIALIYDVANDCTLKTDRGKVRQILVNLVSNGVKFTEAGSVRVSGDCNAGNEAVITVADTGSGIAEPDLPRIFEPFHQLQRATTRSAGGTGLGLAITKRFAELLGGSVAVSSKVGKGTVFTVRIPLEPEP